MANKQKIAKWHKNKTNTWLNNQGETEQKINNNAAPADIINKSKWHKKLRKKIGVNQMLGQLFWRNKNGKRNSENLRYKVSTATTTQRKWRGRRGAKRMGTHTHTHNQSQSRDIFALLSHWISLIFPSFNTLFQFDFFWLFSDRFVALCGGGDFFHFASSFSDFFFIQHLRVGQTN